MSIIKNVFAGGFVLCCDCCGYEEDNIPTFDDAVILKKREGWKSHLIAENEWEEYCSYCVEEGEE